MVIDTRGDVHSLDAMSWDADGFDVDFLVVREVDKDGRIWMRASEWSLLRHLGSHGVVCAVEGGNVRRIEAERMVGVRVDDRSRRVAVDLAQVKA